MEFLIFKNVISIDKTRIVGQKSLVKEFDLFWSLEKCTNAES